MVKKIVITGAAGFIGSCLTGYLNRLGEERILAVDDFGNTEKKKNLGARVIAEGIHRDFFIEWFEKHHDQVEEVYHIGARTDTAEFDVAVFDKLNVNYSKDIWRICTKYQIPLIYASSAATYGDGELGYNDDHKLVPRLKPLNPYGASKQEFDEWALKQEFCPPFWAGLKFFNVYGPNEYHKGRMASVAYHSFHQVRNTGKVRLFKSHRPDFEDGRQLRDFIYVKDVVEICRFLMKQKPSSGIYNTGTGKAATFLDLAHAVFKAMEKEPVIEFIDMPTDIRDKYQYFTEARIDKLRAAGYDQPLTPLPGGVMDYVGNYLLKEKYF